MEEKTRRPIRPERYLSLKEEKRGGEEKKLLQIFKKQKQKQKQNKTKQNKKKKNIQKTYKTNRQDKRRCPKERTLL